MLQKKGYNQLPVSANGILGHPFLTLDGNKARQGLWEMLKQKIMVANIDVG